MSLQGLCGAHRVGKTTLAREYAKKHGIQFVETPVSAIFRELGHDPAAEFDFTTRLDIQEVILKRLDAVYGGLHPGIPAITDRTPIDMMAYTMADANKHAVPAHEQERLAKYIQDCFDVINKRFSTVILVQPGIPMKDEDEVGKGAANKAYIEHLNSIMLGLTVDERLKCSHFYIVRKMLSLGDRISALESAIRQSGGQAAKQAEAYVMSGGYLQ